MNGSQANCIYISSRGFMKLCDFYSNNPDTGMKNFNGYPGMNTLIEHKCPIIYVCNTAIWYFICNVLSSIATSFILQSSYKSFTAGDIS